MPARFPFRRVASAAALASLAPAAWAVEFQTSNPDLKVRLDTTVQYTAAQRLKSSLPSLVDTSTGINNADDGNRNFRKGDLFLNRVDVFSEFDAKYKEFGARVSVGGWYDEAYHGSTGSPALRTGFNGDAGTADRFATATRNLHGQHAEILDAFVFGAMPLGETRASFRLGRHTLLWGESLIFTGNGIASGQAPVDTIKALNKPGALAKEVFMPVSQLSGQLELNDRLTLAGYYQFEWRKTRINAAGSYFSASDVLDANGQRLFVPASVPIPGSFYFGRTDDRKPPNSGQFGLSTRYRFDTADVGLYALQFHDKTPQILLEPSAVPSFSPEGFQVGSYKLDYARRIQMFGASVSTVLGATSVGFEGSVRRRQPLGSNAVVYAGGDPTYPLGRTMHLQANALHAFERSQLWDSLALAAEVAYNRVLKVTDNPAATANGLPAGHEKDGLALGVQITPGYNNVFANTNLTFPVTMVYVPRGKSAALATRAFGGTDGSGYISLGMNAEYASRWTFGVAYTHYVGSGTVANPAVDPLPPQAYKDRDFLSLSVKTSF